MTVRTETLSLLVGLAALAAAGCSAILGIGDVPNAAESDDGGSTEGGGEGGIDGSTLAPIILASGQSNPERIAVDGTSVFWATSGNVVKCATNGCGGVPTILSFSQVAGSIKGIAVDDTFVFWTNNARSEVVGCAKASLNDCTNTSKVFASAELSPDAITVDGETIYWTSSDTAESPVRTCAIAGCAQPTPFASTAGSASRIVVDGTNVYWTDKAGSVRQCPKGGCGGNPIVLSSKSASIGGIGADLQSVYWSTDKEIIKCAIGGCGDTPSSVASGQRAFGGIAVSSAHVYWTNSDDGTVMKCAKAGCADRPTVIASGQKFPTGIATFGASVYWTNRDGGTVVKLTLE